MIQRHKLPTAIIILWFVLRDLGSALLDLIFLRWLWHQPKLKGSLSAKSKTHR